MPNYKMMYYELAGKVADAIDLLTDAMQRGELAYMQQEDDPDTDATLLGDRMTADDPRGTP